MHAASMKALATEETRAISPRAAVTAAIQISAEHWLVPQRRHHVSRARHRARAVRPTDVTAAGGAIRRRANVARHQVTAEARRAAAAPAASIARSMRARCR